MEGGFARLGMTEALFYFTIVGLGQWKIEWKMDSKCMVCLSSRGFDLGLLVLCFSRKLGGWADWIY